MLFLALLLAYQVLIQGPLTAVLNERRGRTEGAVERAHKAISEAEARAAEYADRLRQARAEAYKAREQRLNQLSAEREAALERARMIAGEKVNLARKELDAEAAKAQVAIQNSAADLARQVVRAVLPAATGGSR